jgi:acetyl-CoA hydrolase
MKIPVTIPLEDLDFAGLIRAGDTVGWAQATAEPVLLTRLLDRQAERCPPFRLFFALTFAADFAADHPNVTVTAFGGAGAGRRFFADGAGGVVPANISGLCELIARGRPRIDVVLLQVAGPDETGKYNAGLGIECLREMIAGARLVIAQINPLLPWTMGDTLIEPGDIDILVPAAHPLLELPTRTIGPVERALAGHIARMVAARDTV